jgi:hypothetical protein
VLPPFIVFLGLALSIFFLMFVFGLVYRHFQQYFGFFSAVSFIDGGNRSTRRKPPTYRKSLTNL